MNKNKESDVIKLTAKVAKLEEALRKQEVASHLETKLKESKLPVAVTKKFREAIGEAKSKDQIDSSLKMFVEAYKLGEENDGLVTSVEKNETETTTGGVSSLDDCVEA